MGITILAAVIFMLAAIATGVVQTPVYRQKRQQAENRRVIAELVQRSSSRR